MIKWVNEKAFMFNRQLGYRQGDEFITFRIREAHYFRNYNGYGISSELLDDLKKKGINLIIIIIKYEKYKLIAKIDTWLNNGVAYHHKDYEPQLILNEKYFSVAGARQNGY